LRTLALALLLCLPAAALPQQRQYIDVGAPNFRPLPIALPAFKSDAAAAAEAQLAAEVLRRDLTLTGLFDLLDPRSFLAEPDEGISAPFIKFGRWSDVGAEGLIKASVKKSTELSAEFHLFEVRAGREVLGATHRGPPDAARLLAHRFADDVIRYYTREPGVFRTRIAAFRKSGEGRELVVMDVDGQGAEVVYRDEVALLPSWRPDGKAVLFTSFRDGRPDLWEVEVASRKARRVMSLGDLTTGGVYSPDGKQIAFAASSGGNSDVYVCNADGSDPRRLTTDPATDSSPSWSPDGKRIAFVSSRSGHPHIYLMAADGSEQRRLTFDGKYNQTPRWSPRGDLIAFTARDERRAFDVFTVSPETGRIQRVTQDQGITNQEPSWAPNGRLLVFSSDRSGGSRLVISTPSGERQTPITGGEGDWETPVWGPYP
jgi:TolB protein